MSQRLEFLNIMADNTEPVEVLLETNQNCVNDSNLPTAINVLLTDDNSVLPTDVSHLNGNFLSSNKTVNTPLPTDISYLKSKLLDSHEAINTSPPTDITHLNRNLLSSDKAVSTSLPADIYNLKSNLLDSHEAVNTSPPTDITHLNSNLLSSDKAVDTSLLADVSYKRSNLLDSHKAVNTSPPTDITHLNSNLLSSDKAVSTSLLADISNLKSTLLDSHEAVNTSQPTDITHLNSNLLSSDKAIDTSLLADVSYKKSNLLDNHEAVNTSPPTDITHLNSNLLSSDKAINTSLLADVSYKRSNLLDNHEAVNTFLPTDITYLNSNLLSSDKAIDTSLLVEVSYKKSNLLDSHEAVNTSPPTDITHLNSNLLSSDKAIDTSLLADVSYKKSNLLDNHEAVNTSPPTDITHLNSNLLSSDKAINTSLLADVSYKKSNLLDSHEAVNTFLPTDITYLNSNLLNSDKVIDTSLLADVSCKKSNLLDSHEAVNTSPPTDITYLNGNLLSSDKAIDTSLLAVVSYKRSNLLDNHEAVNTSPPTDITHLNSNLLSNDKAINTFLLADVSYKKSNLLDSHEAVNTFPPTDITHLNSNLLNSDKVIDTSLLADVSCKKSNLLDSHKAVNTSPPTDITYLNSNLLSSDKAIDTSLLADVSYKRSNLLDSHEAVNTSPPTDITHLNSNLLNSDKAIDTSLLADVSCKKSNLLDSHEAVNTSPPTDITHLNSNLLSSDKAIDTSLLVEVSYKKSNLLDSHEAVNTFPPTDITHLNSNLLSSDKAIDTSLLADVSYKKSNLLDSHEAVNTSPPTDITHLNSNLLSSDKAIDTSLLADVSYKKSNLLDSHEAVNTSPPTDITHLNSNLLCSDKAIDTSLLVEVSYKKSNLLDSHEAVNTFPPTDITHLNSNLLSSDKAIDTSLLADVSYKKSNLLDSHEAVNTSLPTDITHLNSNLLSSDKAIDTSLLADVSYKKSNLLDSHEAVNTSPPTDITHLNSNLLSSDKAVNTSMLADVSYKRSNLLDSHEAVNTSPPTDITYLNSNSLSSDKTVCISNLNSDSLNNDETVNISLPTDKSHLNSNFSNDKAINTPLPTDTYYLNSNSLNNEETVNLPLPINIPHLNSNSLSSNEAVIPSLQESLSNTEVDSLDKPISSITKQIVNYNIGDIVWAKIGRYPYWPSIVCNDPTLNIHYKAKKRFLLHVRFCNDKGRRSWATTIENYFGKLALLSKYPNYLDFFKNSKKLTETWNLAIKEADNLMTLNSELRMIEFFKAFSNSDSVTQSVTNNSSEGNVSALKVRTYSRKRSLTVSEQDIDSKIMKTENNSTDCTSSRSIDIPLLSKSDDADSTISDFSMSYAFMGDLGLNGKQEIVKKRRPTKTYPPKNSFVNKYDLTYSIPNSLENNSVSDNQDKYPVTTTKNSTRRVSEHRKLEISILEGEYDPDNIILPSSRRSKKKNTIHMNSSSSKKTIIKKKLIGKENSTGRKSTTVKHESSHEPDTTESEASSKNETYSSVFVTTSKNKQLFAKTWKRACVVCKDIKNTIKCLGPCQSYFHIECLDKSEERYHQTKSISPMIKIKSKKTSGSGRRKRNYSKILQKNEDSISDIPQLIDNIKEENTIKLSKEDNEVKLNCLSDTQCSGYTNEETMSPNELDSDNLLFKNDSCILNENENTQSELESVNSIQETSEEKNIDVPIVPINIDEKIPLDNLKYMCSLCKANKTNCFLCGLVIDDSGQMIVCKISSCGKYYHETCLNDWPQCQWTQVSRNNVQCVVCPHHVCHLCISDNPKSSCKTHFPAEKLTRCIKCPTAYHRSEYCLPAGCQVLTYNDIICSRHFEPVKMQNYHFNATWCFICALGGGSLVCCDLCPSSFHVNCLNQNPSEFERGFTCEECQTGRYPLYGEIVWVKIGKYRWWPAEIVFPNQVPDTVNAIPHSVGQFAVRFFGTYDYYWVNRGRVFNFHEGDDENIFKKSKMKVIDQVFQDSIMEAAQAHNAYILEKEKNDATVAKSFTKPPKFTRIKFNRPIGKVKNMEFDITPMTPCECDPTKPNPCGPGSDCINRMLMFECGPKVCPAGNKCNNQRFEKTLYPAMVPFLTKGRGWGLKTLEDIKEGSFVIEYVGDVIDEEEFQRRCLEMHKRNEQNYYFLTIDNSRTIDAGPRGNLSRFMNHSCEPNCVTQKWTVNGDTRIGLFALHDIPTGTELVFDYRLQSCSGVEKKPCQCGAARCSKFIGVKVEEEKKKVISINDVDKCKVSSKNKRKPLKLKDNISDADKSKLINNDQNNSTAENEVEASNAEKVDLSKKSKSKKSIAKPSTVLKKENSESSETSVIKRKWKKSPRNSSNNTKDDITIDDSTESDGNVNSKRKLRNGLSTLSTRKLLIKDNTLDTDDFVVMKKERQLHSFKKKNVIKPDVLLLPSPSLTKLSSATTLCISEKNANDIKSDVSTKTQEKSRNNLTRLAKSRHLFLSKNNMSKETKVQPVISSIKVNKEKKKLSKITKVIKNSEKTVVMKKTKTNKNFLQSKAYFKNNSCLICGKGHTELVCKNKKCPRVFHLSCINKTRIVKSGFICPSHFCSLCNKRKVVAKCKFCIKSFCAVHVKGNIFKDPLGNGMLCTTHHPNKTSMLNVSNPVILDPNTSTKVNIINNNEEPIDFVDPDYNITISEQAEDMNEDSLNINIDEMNEEEYTQAQVVKDECDREYIHIGGFNVCNVSDLVSDQGESYMAPLDTDGDLFKPSLANVVIDIESASAFYQPMDNLQLVSIATDYKDSHDYANVNFITEANQTKNKWLAAEP